MTVETALMAMRDDSPEGAQARQRDYLEQIQPWVRLKAGMVPTGGFSIMLGADGSIGARIDHWSQSQVELIAMIDNEIASVSERFGLTAAGEAK